MTSISDTNVVNAPGGLVELGYREVTSAVTVTGTQGSQTTIIPATTIVCDGSPIFIEFYSPYVQYPNVANNWCVFSLWVDGVLESFLSENFYNASALGNFDGGPGIGHRRLVPSAGVHTFEIRAWRNGSNVVVGAGGGYAPMYLKISKIIQASQLIVQTPNAPLVTSLPSNAIDGQEVRYLADNTNGIIWNLRYRAGSPSSYKWEFIGGSPLFASYRMGETPDATTSSSYVDLGGPSLTAPLAGDYDVIITGNYYAGAATGAALMSANFGGATTLDDDGILFAQAAQYSHQESRKKIRKLNTITSGMIVGTRYRTYSGSTQSNFRRRTIELIPIRVSA
jgi:hypothetical protein